jgi:hypothetical protein
VCPTIGIRVGLHYKPYKLEGDPWTHKWMNMQMKFHSLMRQIIGSWRIKMKGYLKSKEAGVWDTVVVGPIPLKNQSKFAAKRNNAITFKTILKGLSGSVKESIGKCTSQGPMVEAREGISRQRRQFHQGQ